MDISVVIPCYNGAETLHDTLEAIAQQKCEKEWEIVFSDNGSTDRSREIALSFVDKVPCLRIVDSFEKRGQPFALNNGTAHARGESVIYCDADDIPLPGWLKAMGEALESSDIVACRTDSHRINPEWAAASRSNVQGEGLQKLDYPPYFHHAGGGTLGVKKSLHHKVGGFDPGFPYLHDTDFCIKAQMAGHEIRYVKDAVLCYRYRLDYPSIFRQAKGYGEYNILLSKKYRNTAEPPKSRWRRFRKEITRSIKYFLKQGKNRTEIAEAYSKIGWTFGRLKGVIKYRYPPF